MPNRVKHLSGEHGGYWYLDPGVGGDPFRNRGGLQRYIGGSTWNSFDNLTAGHHESDLLDQSKRSYRTKWLDPWSRENRDFWGHNFATHKYNFSEYSPGDRQHFTGALRSLITPEERDDHNEEISYSAWGRPGTEHEILDWNAYNLDPLYSGALQTRHGRDKFLTLQDIWDAEEVMKGSWQAPAPPPPPAPPAPVAPQTPHIDYEKILEDLGIAHEKAIGGWESQYAGLEEEFGQQAESHSAEIKRLRDEFNDKILEQQSASAQKARDLESQLNIDFAAKFAEQQDTLTNYYDDLLSGARDDAEAARIEQARKAEQIRLDQEAGWKEQERAWKTQDAVYQDQLYELAGNLGVQKDLYSGLESDHFKLQTQFGDAKSDWALQAGDFKADIGNLTGQVSGLETSLGDYKEHNTKLEAAVKRNEELAIQNAERARVSASYGSQGKPLNQQVKGVRTLNELTPTKKRHSGTRGAFNRQGLRISNLNI